MGTVSRWRIQAEGKEAQLDTTNNPLNMADEWYYVDEETTEQVGPTPIPELRALFKKKAIDDDTFFWKVSRILRCRVPNGAGLIVALFTSDRMAKPSGSHWRTFPSSRPSSSPPRPPRRRRRNLRCPLGLLSLPSR